MLRTLLSHVLPGSDDGRDETDSDRDGTDSEFAGSRLDASVRHAHGGDVTIEDDVDADEPRVAGAGGRAGTVAGVSRS